MTHTSTTRSSSNLFEWNCENGRLRIQRSLGGTVRPEAQHRVHAGRNIDNAPPTGFEHTGHERCNEGVRGHAIYLQEIPVELDAERPLPWLPFGQEVGPESFRSDSRIVHEDVDVTEPIEDRKSTRLNSSH